MTHLFRFLIFILVSTCLSTSAFSSDIKKVLGLRHYEGIHLCQGMTDHEKHPKATGKVKAIMLFAKFPDAEREETSKALYERLVPGAVKFFKESSYGKFSLQVDAHHKWYEMDAPSTDKRYDCSRHDTHKGYVREVMEKADKEVDFSSYSVVYVVATYNKGTFNSPTLLCPKGQGIKMDGREIRNAVTFGNDTRNEDWGWQTLVHETGHVLGLPDLYCYHREKTYKSIHKFIGSWDPMGYHKNASQFLAWHKYKFNWLDDKNFHIFTGKEKKLELVHIKNDKGLKAAVIPLSESLALVAEVKNLNKDKTEDGVLLYTVDTKGTSGNGSIKVIPAKKDDDKNNAVLAKKYISLYNALFFEGDKYVYKNIGFNVLKKTKSGFTVEIRRLRQN